MNFINYVDFPGQSFQTLDLQDRQTHRQMRLKTLARRIGGGKKKQQSTVVKSYQTLVST